MVNLRFAGLFAQRLLRRGLQDKNCVPDDQVHNGFAHLTRKRGYILRCGWQNRAALRTQA